MKNLIQLLVIAEIIISSACSQTKNDKLKIPGIPGELILCNMTEECVYQQDSLTITAGELTDLFIDPGMKYQVMNSPMALFHPADTFLLSCKVRVDFKSDYDAGVLILYEEENHWAKLCFEYSPQKIPMIVSVVTDDISDDCNHTAIDTNCVYLRVAGLGENIFAFHYSLDGSHWNLVRYFMLAEVKNLYAGFSSQSPTGENCTSVFSNIFYESKYLDNIRNGE